MIEPSTLDSSVPTNGYMEKKNFALATKSIQVCAVEAEVEKQEQEHDLTSHRMEDDNDSDNSSISEKVYTGFYKYMHEANQCRLRCGEFVNQEKVQVFLVVLIAIKCDYDGDWNLQLCAKRCTSLIRIPNSRPGILDHFHNRIASSIYLLRVETTVGWMAGL